MKNIKIGIKLLSSYLIIAILAGVVGIFGISKIHEIEDSGGKMYKTMTIPISQIADMTDAFQRIRVNVREYIYTNNETNRAKFYNRIFELDAMFDEASVEYEKTLFSVDGRKLWENSVEAMKVYMEHMPELKQAIESVQVEEEKSNIDKALFILTGDMQKANEDVQKSLDEMVHSKLTFAKENFEQNTIIADSATILMITIIIVAVVLAIVIGIVITQAVTKPLAKGVKYAEALASGDLTSTLDVEQKDEIGILANSLRNMVEKLKEVVEAVVNGANNIGSASEEMSSSSQEVSQGASEQASSAEEVSSSMEEMVSNIQQNTDNAQQTEKISAKAALDIIEGSNNVNQTVEAMKKIADKVAIISDIAFQTNILALNAAVEAARAGEHGKGFAVVAAEVRKLAERSQIAANEINGLSKSSVEIAEKSGKLLNAIVPDIQKTSKLVQEITAASIEQNSGADQINNAINQLNQVTQQNAAASEEMATSAEELSSQAEQLQEIISFFKIDNKGSKTRMTSNITSKKNSNIKVVHLDKKKTFANSPKKMGAELQMFENKHDSDFEKF